MEIKGREGKTTDCFQWRAWEAEQSVPGNPLSVLRKALNIKLKSQSPFKPNLGSLTYFIFISRSNKV